MDFNSIVWLIVSGWVAVAGAYIYSYRHHIELFNPEEPSASRQRLNHAARHVGLMLYGMFLSFFIAVVGIAFAVIVARQLGAVW